MTLNFSLVFLLTLFSLFWFVSLWCLLSLLLVFSFPTFFLFFCLPFFSFHISSPYVCLSLCLFTLSLVLPLLIPFFENSPLFFFFFKKDLLFHLFIPFCKTVFVPSPLLFRPFSCLFLFFQSCSFEQDKLTFFSWQKNHLFNTSKNLFPEFLLIFSKGLSSFCFSNFSKFPFSKKKKTVLLNFWENSTQKWIWQKMIVQISLSGNLFVFRKNPSLQHLQKNVFIFSFLCLSSFKKRFLEKISFEKIVFLKKTKLLLSPLDFCSIFILSKNSFLFFSVLLFFQLSCYLFFLLFLIVFFWCLFFRTKKWC